MTLYVDGEPVTVVGSKRSGGRPVVRVEPPVPRGAELTLPRSELPETEEDEYYAFELVGLAVEDEGGRALGCVVDVAPGVANDVLELDSGLALPLVGECVREVDLERRRIVIGVGFADS